MTGGSVCGDSRVTDLPEWTRCTRSGRLVSIYLIRSNISDARHSNVSSENAIDSGSGDVVESTDDSRIVRPSAVRSIRYPMVRLAGAWGALSRCRRTIGAACILRGSAALGIKGGIPFDDRRS